MADTVDTTSRRPWWRRLATRLQLRRVVTRDVLILAALAGLAVTQPLLDLFGRNPEFFVAQDISKYEVVLFAVVVTLLVPAVCAVIELLAYAIGRTVGRVTHVVLVAVLATTLGLSVANMIGLGDVLYVSVALLIGVGITVASVRVRAVELILRYLSGALILFLVSFLFFSRSGEWIRSGEAGAAVGVRVGNPAPVVIVQLDEFPVSSILDAEGDINAERYPNFARLADEGSWFRNATSVSPNTTDSVPAALSGKLPELGALPTSADHPETVFTLLGEDYRMVVDEPVTDLCPVAVCGGVQPERFNVERTENAFRDASVVLGHIVLPPFLAVDLPKVDQSWGGFLADDRVQSGPDGADESLSEGADTSGFSAGSASGSGSSPSFSASTKWKALGPAGWAPRFQAQIIETEVDAIESTAEPTLWFSHAVFPHIPWQLAPDGLQFASGDSRFVPGVEGGVWTDEEWLVRQGLQRHLLQVGYADTLIGDLIDKLEDEGLWEDALVVVMADHGSGFQPGAGFRGSGVENVHEIYNVPLFIKEPGTTEGEVRDDNALLIDVLPSIVDLLEIDTDWRFDGRSLFGSEPEPDTKPVEFASGPTEVPVDFAGVMAVVERNLAWMPYGDDITSIAAIGQFGGLVGQPIESLDIAGDSAVQWSVDQADRLADWQPDQDGFIPLLWTGRVTMPDGGPPPPELLAVVNGRVAGVVGGFGVGDNGPDQFSAMIAPDPLVVGANEVSLLVPLDGGTRFEVTAGPT